MSGSVEERGVVGILESGCEDLDECGVRGERLSLTFEEQFGDFVQLLTTILLAEEVKVFEQKFASAFA